MRNRRHLRDGVHIRFITRRRPIGYGNERTNAVADDLIARAFGLLVRGTDARRKIHGTDVVRSNSSAQRIVLCDLLVIGYAVACLAGSIRVEHIGVVEDERLIL